jgi:hypothetical protein
MRRVARNLTASLACVFVLTVATGLTAGAAVQPPAQNPTTGHKGAPIFNCTPGTNSPGNAVNGPGSAFNPNGTAGAHYAGNQGTSSQAHSNSTAAVSQYDNACR